MALLVLAVVTLIVMIFILFCYSVSQIGSREAYGNQSFEQKSEMISFDQIEQRNE